MAARKPIRVFYSELSGEFYATDAYRIKDGVAVITGRKDNVTQDIARAVVNHGVTFREVATPTEEQDDG
jgi:2-keto-3-deoxy-6-phosphogluconate aldolase